MSQPPRPSYPPRLLTAAVACFMVYVAWQWHRTDPIREPYQLIPWNFMVASPVADGLPTASAFEATVSAWVAGTVVPTPRPWLPTVTPRPSCTGAMSQGLVCWAATLAPTLPAPVVLPTPAPLPTWPGDGRSTPGGTYVMGQSEATP